MSDPLLRPSLGRIVIYKLGGSDDPTVNNGATECAAMIVRVWSDTCVNLQLMLDGTNMSWKTSVLLGDQPGQWSWPKFVPPKIAEGTHR